MIFATDAANNAAADYDHIQVRPLTGALGAEVFAARRRAAGRPTPSTRPPWPRSARPRSPTSWCSSGTRISTSTRSSPSALGGEPSATIRSWPASTRTPTWSRWSRRPTRKFRWCSAGRGTPTGRSSRRRRRSPSSTARTSPTMGATRCGRTCTWPPTISRRACAPRWPNCAPSTRRSGPTAPRPPTTTWSSTWTSSTGRRPTRSEPSPSSAAIPTPGGTALFVNWGYTESIEGWWPDESQALLDHLFEVATNPVYTCRFRWRPARSRCGTTGAPCTIP